MRCSQRFSNIWPRVCGKDRMEAAKITGITPPVLRRSGQVGALAAVHPATDHALGVLDRIRRWARSM